MYDETYNLGTAAHPARRILALKPRRNSWRRFHLRHILAYPVRDPVRPVFHWMYFSLVGRQGIGLLIPGGILLTAGIVSQIASLFDSWGSMWPGFILAVAAGLFEFYWFGSRNKWLLIPINILTVLSLLFFVVFSIGPVLNYLSVVQPVIAVLLVLGGAWLMLGRKRHG